MAPSACARALRWTLWSLAAASITSACSGPEFTIKAGGGAGLSGTSGRGSAVAGEGAEAGSSGGSGRAGNAGASGGDTNGGRGGSGARAGTTQSSGRGGSGGAARAGTGGGGAGRGAAGGSGGEGPGGVGGLGVGGLGVGGLGIGGVGAIGGTSSGFPATGVLDDFDREGPGLGDDWTGSTSDYALASKQLSCSVEYCPGVFWNEEFGPVQEVFATLVAFTSSTPEINLVLKAQGDPHCDMLELLYSAGLNQVLLEACWEGDWRSLGTVAMSLELGDQLGGRARDDGVVEIFKNGSPSGTIDASGYPYIAVEGSIGVNGVVAPGDAPNAWDDFGGGSL